MERKVIQLAGKTLVVSLPSKWVKKNQVMKGDTIELTEEEKRIIISTSKEKIFESKIINANQDFDPLYIAYLYQSGVDEIKIKYHDSKVFSKIQQKIPDLMGYEIIDQGEDYISIKNVSKALEEEFDSLLRRTFYLIDELATGSIDAYKDKDRINSLMTFENSIDKFTDFCKRVLSKKGHKDSSKTNFYYVIIRDLEKIGDYYHELLEFFDTEKISLSNETVDVYKEVNMFMNSFHKLFYKFDETEGIKFRNQKKSLLKKLMLLLNTVPRKELFIIYNLLGLTKVIGNLYGPYYITRL
mgnify:CR=1 FL=1